MSRSSVKTRLLVCFALLCIGAFISGIVYALENSFSSDQAYAQDLIRLHVIAHSNLPQDQELKLKVRDAVLQEAKCILSEVPGRQEAYAVLLDHAQQLEHRAQAAVYANGFDYPVQVKLGNYMFPHRDYGGWSLPEGWYDAVRVEIGAAKGENWWCILFPPLCLAELEGASSNLVKVDRHEQVGEETERRFVFTFKLWEQVAQTRYAQVFQRWWQASAAGLAALSR